MQAMLQMCAEIDQRAEQVYRDLAAACPSTELAVVFEHMAKEEHVHVEWWNDLLVAWQDGLLPDIADEHGILERLREIHSELDLAIPADCDAASADQMLSIAAHLEFYMLDPVFGELVDLLQPGSTVEHRESYARHVDRLVEAIETHYSGRDLAAFLARVLRRAFRDQQRLAALATRDQLTGLFNRRGLFGHLAQWLSWSNRYQRPVGVALIDIDHFKTINDRFGHAAGDTAIVQVSRAIEAATRASDIIGRFGGDEFIVLAMELGEEEMSQLLERIVETVRSSQIAVGDASLIVTVSAGGSWVSGGAQVTPEVAVASADRSLYEAKAAGRDRAGRPRLADPVVAI